MKHFLKLLFSLLLLPSLWCAAQRDSSFRLAQTIRTDISDLSIDNMGNLYVFSSTGGLKKYTAKGDSAGVYNEIKKYGQLSSIDATNPLKLLLYYKDFSTVVILDRLLSVRTALDLRRHRIMGASAIGLSYDNNIWLFDEYENKLKKIDEEGTLQLETPDLRNVFSTALQPQQIIDQNGQVYLYDAKNGVYVFDYYGTFKKKLPITQWKNISVIDKYVFGTSGNTLNVYNTATLLTSQIRLPFDADATHHYHVAVNKLFAWTKDTLQIFTYPL